MQGKEQKVYIAIDLKSFYASVECNERSLDPLTTNLVVADNSRTEKTICLAVTPSLKAYGIPGRARLFEVIQKVKEINAERRQKVPNHNFTGVSYDSIALKNNIDLEVGYIVAPPRMAYYKEYSTKIYNIYLKYFSPEDIYSYSIDEIFCDITKYLKTYNMRAKELATKVIHDVYNSTGITATCGIGTNMYLCKIAMDIVAKHVEPDKNGVRIAWLDEMKYRKLLWDHKPLTDFWRVGKGYSKKLEKNGMFTMGDIARKSIENEDLLYKLFGVSAELLIDHSWGWEPVTIQSAKNYKPQSNSLSLGQVLHCPYNFNDAKVIVKSMAESLSYDLVAKNILTKQIVLTIEYDIENLINSNISNAYKGEITIDRYGRKVPKHAHGTINLDHYTSSAKIIRENANKLYCKIVNEKLLIRKIYIVANNILSEKQVKEKQKYEQVNLFADYNKIEQDIKKEMQEKQMQKSMLKMKEKYGKNAVLKGADFLDVATTRDRNSQIGGHKA